MSRILVLFIDGVGIGENDPAKNPFFSGRFNFFNEFFGETPHLQKQYLSGENIELFPLDARMGIEGIPQSGTGQTSIFCGVNAPALINQHFGPFPYSTLIPVIKEENIFIDFLKRGQKPFFMNSYPQVFFDYLNSGKSRLSVSTLSYRSAGLELNTADDVRRGYSLSAEITNRVWRERLKYEDISLITPEEAAERLLQRTAEHDFTLYEFFLTDHLGHGRIPHDFDIVSSDLDRFLIHIFKEYSREETDILLCSDHGNFEDITIKAHTRNPALGIAAGKNAGRLRDRISSLYQIKQALLEL
ncbi:MAG: metalloenzyme [Ignavibacteriales bacterium]|nr:MAG: metalloenzyme [Ignavibacteriales bacterium]